MSAPKPISPHIPAVWKNPWHRYVLAVATFVASFLVRYALTDLLAGDHGFVLFLPAVVLTTLLAGLTPGIITGALSGLAIWYFFLPPAYSWRLTGEGAVGLASFAVVAGIAVALVHWLRLTINYLEIERTATAALAKHRQVLIEATPNGLVLVDSDGIIRLANERLGTLFGYEPKELVGQPVEQLVPIRYRGSHASLRAGFARHPANRPMGIGRDLYGLRKDGGEFPIEIGLSSFAAGGAEMSMATVIDISERKRAEQALALALERQSSLYRFVGRLHRAKTPEEIRDAALDAIQAVLHCHRAAILLLDDAGVMRFVRWRALSEEYRQAVEGHSPWAADETNPQPVCIDNIDKADIADSLRAAVKAEGLRALAFIPLNTRGKLVGKLMIYYEEPHVFSEDEIELALSIGRQLRLSIEKNHVENELRDSEERFRNLADHMAQFAWMADSKGWLFWYNQRWFDYTGTTLEEMEGWGWQKVHHPDHVERVVKRLRHSWETGEPWEDTFPLRGRDGGYRWFLSRAVPIRDAGGAIVRWFGTNTDVTEQRATEEALRNSEQRLEFALAAGHMGAWEWNIDTGQVDWSPALQEIHGFKPGEFSGTFEDFKRDIHPEDLETVLVQTRQTLESRRPHHLLYRVKLQDGTIRWLEAFGDFVPRPEGSPQKLAGVCMDVTERKRSEEREKLLVGELQHRTKNLFSVVRALALRSLRGNYTLDEAREAFTGRLQALSRADQRVTESPWQGTRLEEVVRSELEPFAGRFDIHGEEVILNPQAAQNFALTLHELATNASKYGALSNVDGRVEVGWANGGDSLKFRWKELGGPQVSPPSRSGFGTSLLEAVLGQARIEYAKRGLIYEVDVPLSSITHDHDPIPPQAREAVIHGSTPAEPA